MSQQSLGPSFIFWLSFASIVMLNSALQDAVATTYFNTRTGTLIGTGANAYLGNSTTVASDIAIACEGPYSMGPIHKLTLQDIIARKGDQEFRDHFILENVAQKAGLPLTMWLSERSNSGDLESNDNCAPAAILSRYSLKFVCANKQEKHHVMCYGLHWTRPGSS